MKKIVNILFYFIISLIFLLAFAFLIIEARLLISGDFMLYDNYLNGFLRYFLRFLISLSYLLVCFFECFKYYKRSLKIVNHLYSLEILLLIISVMLLLCTTNYIGIICFGLTSMLVILKTFKITKFDK